jgi:hypothetical protein
VEEGEEEEEEGAYNGAEAVVGASPSLIMTIQPVLLRICRPGKY